jgi:hypothetical protein
VTACVHEAAAQPRVEMVQGAGAPAHNFNNPHDRWLGAFSRAPGGPMIAKVRRRLSLPSHLHTVSTP